MRKVLILLVTTILLVSCASVNKYNKNLQVLRNEKQLKYDVDYINKKLQKLHPNLYWYISKKELDFKFDSLKHTINTPMTSADFYLKLSPVIASIKQGHMQLFPPIKKLKIKELFSIRNLGISPLSRFDFEGFNNKTFIVKNNSDDKSIKVGTEVISVNNIKPQELISKFSKTFTSDGFNKTFIERRLNIDFPTYFFYQNGITDSVICQLKYNDTIKTVYLKRRTTKTNSIKEKNAKQTAVEREQRKKEFKKRTEQGYDRLTKIYSKNLSFVKPDSSIAILKLLDFSKGNYKEFYRSIFKQLDSLKTKTLILDLRDNLGGKLRDDYNLYSYLVDSDFYFVDKQEVVSKFSLLHTNNFRNKSLFAKTIFILFSPLRLIHVSVTFFKVKKGANNKYYYSSFVSKLGHPKPNNFKGKVFVLINGGSFSASCLLSSNLKGSKRAVFVGDETGGAFNGTVAGIMPVVTLPKSKLNIRFKLELIQPHFKTDLEGRGIFPDIEIKPTLEDRINGNDPELKWVLDEIKGQHISKGRGN
ncbi:MAG TPA: S41 family peptidase [Ignavibacteria bacterium]